jgi:PAS domain S-box-containing protein
MISVKRSSLVTFGTALGLCTLALVLTLITPLKTSSPFLLFIVAIILSTYWGSWGHGLVAILFSTIASVYFFVPPIGAFGMVIFEFAALFILFLVSRNNASRKKSEQDVARLVAVVNSSEDAIITKTLNGIILTWNPGAERLFGYSADEVVGKSVQFAYPSDHQDEFQKIIQRLEHGESIDHFDTIRIAKDGRPINVSISETLMRDTQGNVIGVSKIVRDITPRKRAEETARFLSKVNDVLASSLDYETTLASIAQLAVPHIADWCAVYITLEDGTIRPLALTHVDPTKVEHAYELQHLYLDNPNAPYSVPNVIHTGKPELAPPFANAPNPSARNDALLKVSPDPGLKSLMVVPLIAPGRTFGAITFVSSESGRSYGEADLALAQDLARRAALAVDNARLYHTAKSLNQELDQRVTQRTHELEAANQQLRLLAAHLQAAVEEERIKIARAIHDEVGTLMTAIKMDLVFMGRSIKGNGSKKSPDELIEDIKSITKLVDEAIESVHQISRELRPGVLDHLGLRAALEWQMQEFQTRSKIECQFDCDLEDLELPPAQSTAVFRIMQETLTNVARHAQATRVDASLRKEGAQLVLQVRDNGIGISETPDTNRFGILGMRERAHVFGGDVNIHGEPGQGTTVTVRIPLK